MPVAMISASSLMKMNWRGAASIACLELRRGEAPRALPATKASQLLRRTSFDFQLHCYG
jgi:hypothetical protein